MNAPRNLATQNDVTVLCTLVFSAHITLLQFVTKSHHFVIYIVSQAIFFLPKPCACQPFKIKLMNFAPSISCLFVAFPRLLCRGGGSHKSLGTRLACLKRAASAFAYAYKPDPSAALIVSSTHI